MQFATQTMGDLEHHPTKRQIEVLRAMCRLNERLGRAVSHTEIANELGVTAGGVAQTVWRLHQKELVDKADPQLIVKKGGTERWGGQWKVSHRGRRWCT